MVVIVARLISYLKPRELLVIKNKSLAGPTNKTNLNKGLALHLNICDICVRIGWII